MQMQLPPHPYAVIPGDIFPAIIETLEVKENPWSVPQAETIQTTCFSNGRWLLLAVPCLISNEPIHFGPFRLKLPRLWPNVTLAIFKQGLVTLGPAAKPYLICFLRQWENFDLHENLWRQLPNLLTFRWIFRWVIMSPKIRNLCLVIPARANNGISPMAI